MGIPWNSLGNCQNSQEVPGIPKNRRKFQAGQKGKKNLSGDVTCKVSEVSVWSFCCLPSVYQLISVEIYQKKRFASGLMVKKSLPPPFHKPRTFFNLTMLFLSSYFWQLIYSISQLFLLQLIHSIPHLVLKYPLDLIV